MKTLKISVLLISFVSLSFTVTAQLKLTMQDTRTEPTTPGSYSSSFEGHFKEGPRINLPDTYYALLGIRGWYDNSGGKAFELAFGNDGQILTRAGYSPAWEGWRKLVITDENGKVGIGGTSSLSQFHVKDAPYTGTISFGNEVYPALLHSSAVSGELRIDNRSSHFGFISFYPNGEGVALGTEAMRINSSGNIGIGTTSPSSMLSLKRTNASGDLITITRDNYSSNLDFASTYDGMEDLQSGSFAYGVRPSDDSWQIWEKGHHPAWTNLFAVKKNGNIGIGMIDPVEKLAVNGKIRAREVKVENEHWPDYVFAKSYQILTLPETEKHIKEKGHLPNIPSAAEVKANGIDLGEMNAKLLQKIEELTLHLIEKDKQLSEERRINNNQEDRLRRLEMLINK